MKKTISTLLSTCMTITLQSNYWHKMLSKVSAYVKSCDGQTNEWMYFLLEDDDLLEKYDTIWDKISADDKKEFDSEPVYNKIFLKTKIKPHGDKEISKVASNLTCSAIMSLDSTLKKSECF